MTSAYLGNSLNLGFTEKLFKFTVTNPGTVDLRMSTTTITVNVNGLTGDGTATGTMYDWRLYEGNASGGLGTYLAKSNDVGLAGGYGVAVSPSTALSWSTNGSLNVSFGESNDQNNLYDNLIIPANSTRTFILTANTNSIFNGKSEGMVSVQGEITGITGWNWISGWNNGNFNYFYTPVGGSEVGAFSHSDSYSVIGNTLMIAL